MGKILKIALPPLLALGIGFAVGFFLGKVGNNELEAEISKVEKNAAAARSAEAAKLDACRKRLDKSRSGRALLKGREHLLRALLELDRRNFGLASQHLGSARQKIKRGGKGFKEQLAADVKAILERLTKAQTLTMQLKPTARDEIAKSLADLERLPGIR